MLRFLKTSKHAHVTEGRGGGGEWEGLRVVGGEPEPNDPNENIPDKYKYVGMFLGNLVWMFRLSLGDYDLIGEAASMTSSDNILFWIVFVLALIITQIVFLNFIIAEASASYAKVMADLNAIRRKERVSMVSEAEDMTREANKTQKDYPPYVIVRSIEV